MQCMFDEVKISLFQMNWMKNWAHIDNYLQEDCGKFVDWKDSYTKRIEWSSEAYSQDRYWGWAGEKELKILWHPQSHCKTVPGETLAKEYTIALMLTSVLLTFL